MSPTKRSFGAIRRLPSKRYQASYVGPDLARHVAPETFTAKVDAEGWLALERRLVEWDEWTAPEVRRAKQLHDDTQTPLEVPGRSKEAKMSPARFASVRPSVTTSLRADGTPWLMEPISLVIS